MGKSHENQKRHCSVLKVLSKIFFCWTFSSFAKGYSDDFTENDLFPLLDEQEAVTLGDQLEKAWTQEISNPKPSLTKTLIRVYGKEFCLFGFIIFLKEFVVRLIQPLLLWKLITFYTLDLKDTNEAHLYITLMIFSIFTNVLCYHWCNYGLYNLGMKIKIACTSLIYRKSLKMNNRNVATGQIINLLSNDLNRFEKCLLQIHYLWATPLQLIVICYLIYTMLHPSGVVGVAIYFVSLPVYLYTGKKFSEYRLKMAMKSDKRIRLIDEIVFGIETIKMYTWEALFIRRADVARKDEVRYVRKSSFMKAFQSSFNKYLSRGAIFLCIFLYVITGHHVQPQYNFVIKSFYLILKDSMTIFLPEAIKNISETLVSVRRIETLLLNEQVPTITSVQTKQLSIGIRLETSSENNFEAHSGQLVAIIGLVGSGKTSLIKQLLNENHPLDGHVIVNGKISYCSQEPWLFAGSIRDNILFGESFKDNKYKKVIKVCALESDFTLLPYGDLTVVGDRGITLSGGQKARISLARAIYHDADIYLLDDPLSAVDTSVGKQLFEECILNYLKDKCVILVTHQVQYLEKCNNIYLLKNDQIAVVGNFEEICASDKDLAQYLRQSHENEEIDDLEDDPKVKHSNKYYEEECKAKETKNCGKISWRVYKEYLLSGGGLVFFIILAVLLLSQVVLTGSDYFEAYWIKLRETQQSRGIFTEKNCIIFYVAFMISILLFTTLSSISFFAYFTKVSIKLHDKMFSSVIKATLTFFYTNQTGCILNRFSKDIAAIDTTLPKLLLDTLEIVLSGVGVILIISLINPWTLLISVAMILTFYYLRVIYLATSREVKRMEATTRSDIFSHLNETLQGLTTIRAFKVERNVKKQFDTYVNRNSSAFYTLLACSTTFGLWLDMVCSSYIAFVTVNCFKSSGNRGEDLGLVITQAMALTCIIQWGMRQWSEFENEMTSVERIIEYTDLDPEIDSSKETPPESWPSSCDLEFKSIVLTYKKTSPPALNNLTFKIVPKEKIGIVGRTGAGKSSIISALFRLIKFDGHITIDGLDISRLPLETVRSKISIILQEPVLFSGTLRDNLDPFDSFQDHDIWSILEELELKNFVSTLPLNLQSPIMEKGTNLSVGQRQVICLARALLRNNKILILDEATANIDFKTDSLIQSTIKKKFVDCTVLIIAHRLNTIMDCDKVLVMDAGKAIEFDRPYKLLGNENGILHELVMKTGKVMSDNLKLIAKESYEKLPQSET